MANIKSQIKRNRQNEQRRLRNKAVRSEMKTRVKTAVAAAALGLTGSTFPAKKALLQARRLGSAGISRAILLLADADLALKGTIDWPGELVLEVLVARLAAATRRGAAGAPATR